MLLSLSRFQKREQPHSESLMGTPFHSCLEPFSSAGIPGSGFAVSTKHTASPERLKLRVGASMELQQPNFNLSPMDSCPVVCNCGEQTATSLRGWCLLLFLGFCSGVAAGPYLITSPTCTPPAFQVRASRLVFAQPAPTLNCGSSCSRRSSCT